MPKGIHLVSSEALRSSGNRKRSYDIYVAGGRFADVDPPGAGLALSRVLPGCLKEALGSGFSEKSFSCLLEHGYMRLRYLHHGKDRHDAKCLEHILSVLFKEAPSAKVFGRLGKNRISAKQRSVKDFWSWFYSKVSPKWYRMGIPFWTEEQLAEQAKREQGIKYRDRVLYPANLLVTSGEECLHEDLVERLSGLGTADLEARQFICKPPDVIPVQEEYHLGRSSKQRRSLLLFFPLPVERYSYFKTVLAFYALFGEGGFFGDFVRKERLKLKPELFATFWPQPFAFIRLNVSIANVERAKALIALTSLKFNSLPCTHQKKYIKKVINDVGEKYASPIEVMRDEWLGGSKPALLRKYDVFSLSDLEYTVKVYFSEARMGVIQRLPSVPRGQSLFSEI